MDINVSRGVGIREQNIYQIICPSPDTLRNKAKSSPYLLEIYRTRLDDKKTEITQLREKLRGLQKRGSESGRASALRGKSQTSNEMNTFHTPVPKAGATSKR